MCGKKAASKSLTQQIACCQFFYSVVTWFEVVMCWWQTMAAWFELKQRLKHCCAFQHALNTVRHSTSLAQPTTWATDMFPLS
jgi:hypothetical protein